MYHNLAMKDDGTIWGWGKNSFGAVGNGTTTNQSTPVSVTGLSNVIDFEAGLDFSLAVQDDGTVWEWGKNGYISGETAKSTPVQVTELENVIQLAAGHGHTHALKSDGTVWGWGRNNEGVLGNGTTTDETDPVQISGL
ncbi:BNR repeat-containing protein, partial [Candidatus Magnetomorum sp. HK-1]